jgi:Spy/CpxP family protein refolding chaperone
MKPRSTLAVLALLLSATLGMTLPGAAEPPNGTQLAQAPADAPRPGPGMGERAPWGRRPEGPGHMRGRHGWHGRMTAHRFSLTAVALRHQKDLALTPAQVDTLRKLAMDAQRDEIRRHANRRLAQLDLRAMMMPDPADPNKPRDLGAIEAKVREIEKLRADSTIARIRNMEQGRQTLTPEQREKLRALLSQRWQRGPQAPTPGGRRSTGPEDSGSEPASAPEHDRAG